MHQEISQVVGGAHKAMMHDCMVAETSMSLCAKLREILLVLLLVVWPFNEHLVEIDDTHVDGSLSVDYSGGYHGEPAVCGCRALFTFISM